MGRKEEAGEAGLCGAHSESLFASLCGAKVSGAFRLDDRNDFKAFFFLIFGFKILLFPLLNFY